MKCPVCGTSLNEDAKECYVCGFKLEDYNGEFPYQEANNSKNDNDAIDSKRKALNENGSSASDSRIDSSSINSSADGTKQKDTKPTTNKPKKKNTGLIVAIVCIIIAACIIVVLFLTGIIGPGGAELTSEEESAVTDVNEQVSDGISSEQTEEMNVAPNSSYIGYWNISGNEDEELAISNVTEDTVEFSLYSRGKYTLENANAYIDENNFASFACVDDKLMMTGDLIFYDDYIVVDIDRADMDYLDTGTMVFDERHLSSWRENDDESVNSQGITSQNAETSYEVEPYYESGNISSNYDSYYILPDSSTELLDYNDIRYLTKEELRLARNEIYARHGRKFDDPTLQAYFNSQPWYTGTIEPEDFTQDMLSSIERTNVAFIESYE